ncbi:MAG: hypothetical protein AAGA58_14790 [Verrucomicrobiota bacterium]
MKALILAALIALPLSGFAANIQIQTPSGQPILTSANALTDATYLWSYGIYSGFDTSSFAAIQADFTDIATSATSGTSIDANGELNYFEAGVFGFDGQTPSILIYSADESEYALVTGVAPILPFGTSQIVIDPAGAPAVVGSYNGAGSLQLIPEPTSALFVALTGLVALRRRRK